MISIEQKILQYSSKIAGEHTLNGVIVAVVVIGLWASNLISLLSINVSKFPVICIGFAVCLQTFLYTGLFITAHDAMHGVVFFKNLKINHFIGSISVLLYGLFSYKELMEKHWLHHRFPASDRDPDFHGDRQQNFFIWYFQFFKAYFSWKQLIGLIFIFKGLNYVLHLPEINLTLFWVVPSILSSLQLFYFGTFLPHREPKEGYNNFHRTHSTPFPVFLSFITCYHFGYHEEHHEYPCVPWWRLPEIYRKNTITNPIATLDKV